MDSIKGLKCSSKVIPAGRYGSFRSHTCGKPAKGRLKDGSPACGVHLNAEKRAEAADEEYKKRAEAAEIFREEMGACPLAILGWSSGDRTVKVNFDELMTALRKKGE